MNTRAMSLALLVGLTLSASVLAATWDQLPVAIDLHNTDPERIEQDFERLHPWKPGAALPTSFREAGLKPPVKLVFSQLHLDGGSRVYVFRGVNNRFLLLCTDSRMYGSEDGKVVEVENPRLFLAASHFTGKRKVLVPDGSATEAFLLAAIKSETDKAAVKGR